MNLSDAPTKIILPFANNGGKNSIPVASQIPITPGAASWYDGFPPLTRTPKAAGGIPPKGLDMNGVMFSISALSRWANAGAGFIYDNTFATDTDVDGYPMGARILRSDGTGYWLNTVDGNDVDPEATSAGVAAAAGWVPDFTNGSAAVTMTNANVTLTPEQYGKPIIIISGALVADLNLIFPDISNSWIVQNNTSGNYSITCKTQSGTGIFVGSGKVQGIFGDSVNIYASKTECATAGQFDNTTALANTAFVNARGFKSATLAFPTSSEVWTTALAGGSRYTNTASNTTQTLPLASGFLVGQQIRFGNINTGIATITVSGSNHIVTAKGNLTSIDLLAGDTLILESDSSDWILVGGSAALPYAATPQRTVTKLTSGSGTYTTPALVKQLWIRMVGGGGGGAGGGTSGGAGGNGGTTTFNSINANGGFAATAMSGGQGGNGGTGTASLRCPGSGGASGIPTSTATTGGAVGGGSAFAGGAAPSTNGFTNTGGGGSGGGASAASVPTGGAGGAGEYVEILITSPASSYSYAIGAAGTSGSAGTNGTAGGSGGSGLIYITEVY